MVCFAGQSGRARCRAAVALCALVSAWGARPQEAEVLPNDPTHEYEELIQNAPMYRDPSTMQQDAGRVGGTHSKTAGVDEVVQDTRSEVGAAEEKFQTSRAFGSPRKEAFFLQQMYTHKNILDDLFMREKARNSGLALHPGGRLTGGGDLGGGIGGEGTPADDGPEKFSDEALAKPLLEKVDKEFAAKTAGDLSRQQKLGEMMSATDNSNYLAKRTIEDIITKMLVAVNISRERALQHLSDRAVAAIQVAPFYKAYYPKNPDLPSDPAKEVQEGAEEVKDANATGAQDEEKDGSDADPVLDKDASLTTAEPASLLERSAAPAATVQDSWVPAWVQDMLAMLSAGWHSA